MSQRRCATQALGQRTCFRAFTPSHVSPSILVYEDEMEVPSWRATAGDVKGVMNAAHCEGGRFIRGSLPHARGW